MNGDKFTYEIEFRRNRVEQLHQSAKELFLAPRNLLKEAFEELNTALEELEVAYDQLCQKNEELALARLAVEVERQRYQDLFECAPDGYLVTDTNGIIQEANQAAASLLNVERHFLVGKPLLIFIPKEERAAFRFELNWLRLVEREQEWIIHLCPFNGKPFDAALSVATICDWEGKVSGRRWLLRDITYRLETEEMLKIHERVLESLVEGVKVYDENGIIFFTNPAFDAMFGYEQGELTGKHVSILSSTSLQESNRQLGEVGQQLQTQETWKGEFNNRKKDGTLFITSAHISSLEIAGKKYWVSVQEDITKQKRVELALRESEGRYRAVVQQTADGICLIDTASKRILEANAAYCNLLGYTSREILELTLDDVIPMDSALIDRNIQSLSVEKPFFQGEASNRCKDGSLVDVEVSIHLISYGGKEVLCRVIRNITEQKRIDVERQTETRFRQLEEARWESEARLRLALEAVHMGVWDWNILTNDVAYSDPLSEAILRESEATNRALLHAIPDLMFRVSPDGTFLDFKRTKDCNLTLLEQDFLGKKISEVLSGNVAAPYMQAIEQALSTGEVQSFEYQLSQNGNLIDFEARIVSVGDDEALIIVRDITERRQAQAMIQYQAFYDLLTGLPNRTLFNDQLLQSLANASRSRNMVAVMFLDLDRFKTINDTLGHAVGDQLLQQVAQRVAARLREGDTFSRWGGDEFTLLLPQISCSEQVAKIAQRILDALQEPFNLEHHELYITSSIGIALCPCDGEDIQTLLRNADAALYHAKKQGRNNYQFYIPAMNSHAQELLELENRLHHALKQGEFVLYYQPQVNINTGELTGIEALVRWQHPELGLVPPETFIPIAEENGLIVPINEWVLWTACNQNKAWQDAGISSLRVAVNLSPRQFQQSNLVPTVAWILEETGLAPQFLELEITETIIIQNVDFARTMLYDLKAMGIHITMDDFGTGYSSLGYLKKLPFHTLKLDQSFIEELADDPHDKAIISAVIALGQGLNLRVIAEGVETQEQMELLRSLNCEQIQGYLFSRPLPVEEATKFLQDYSPKPVLVGLRECA